MKIPSSRERKQFRYKITDHPIIVAAPFQIESDLLGTITQPRAYLYHVPTYYRILEVERIFDHDGEIEEQIFTCVEAGMEDLLAIRNQIFE